MVSVENNSILKKISAVILVITALVFFSFNVFATTYNPTTYNRYTDAFTDNNVTYDLAVTQLKALSEGTSMLPGGMETIMLVTFQISNRNDQAARCQIPMFSIDLSDQRVITDVYTYGGDLVLGLNSLGFVIYPTEEFSYDQSNSIIVPPHKTLSLVGAIGLPAQLDQTGSSTLDTGLRNVHLLNKPYSITLGNYSYGNPVDLSSVITYIDGIESALNSSNNNTTVIINRLNTIITDLVYSGSNYNLESSSLYTKLQTFTPSGLNGISISVRRSVYPVIVDNIDFEIDSGSDQLISTQSYVYKVVLYFYVNNTSGKAVKCLRFPTIGNFVPSGCSFSLDKFNSNYFNSYTVNQNSLLIGTTYRLPNNTNAGILPYGKDYTFIQYTVYSNTKITSWSDLTFNIFTDTNQVPTYVDDYYPESQESMFFNWYNSYNQVNGVDDSSDISDDVADVSDSNHIIEESYYSANASAIEATGLSNYRFSNEQNNGIGSVSNDFMLLWNALGSWNGVYIFSLTMALATFIMRHGGLFTVKRKESDKGGED